MASALLELPRIVSSPTTWEDDEHLEILNRSSLFHHLLDSHEDDFPGGEVSSSTPFQVATTHLAVVVVTATTLESYEGRSPEVFASVVLALLFGLLEVLGLVGNAMVVAIVLTNKEMRNKSVNLFIANLALSDLCVMLTGVPEATMFIGDMDWPFPNWICKAERFFLITCLYSSILTTLAVSVERFTAIVRPLEVHRLCNRKMVLIMIVLIWIISIISGIPVLMFNQVSDVNHHNNIHARCRIQLPGKFGLVSYKLVESTVFYLLPVLLQVPLYFFVARKLSAGSKEIRRTPPLKNMPKKPLSSAGIRGPNSSLHSAQPPSSSAAAPKMANNKFKSRIEVVKMLAVSALVHFISYLPLQVYQFYSLVTAKDLKVTWSFMLLTIFLSYLSSASKPLLYAVFNETFRMKFIKLLTCKSSEDGVSTLDQIDGRNLKSRRPSEEEKLKRDSTTSESINLMAVSSSQGGRFH